MSKEGRVDLRTKVGELELASPIILASGTAGYADEFFNFGDLNDVGAIVIKSLAHFEYPGNRAPRLQPLKTGMLNNVGLQGPGLKHWIEKELVKHLTKRITTVISLWGFSIDDFEKCLPYVADLPDVIVAIELNLSCPNVNHGDELFAYDPESTYELTKLFCSVKKPIWVKISVQTHKYVDVARAALEAGASALTCFNSIPGAHFKVERDRVLSFKGGYSGPGIFPISLRGVYEIKKRLGNVPIIGIGGINSLEKLLAMVASGASAVSVGTLNFTNPKAAFRLAKSLKKWLKINGFSSFSELKDKVQILAEKLDEQS